MIAKDLLSKGSATTLQKLSNSGRRPCRRPFVRLQVEELEPRCLLSGATLDIAQNLGSLDGAGQIAILGHIANHAGAGEVDWFQFSLKQAATVDLHTTTPPGSASGLDSVISLYNNDPFNFNDPGDILGHRLLTQDAESAANSGASLDQALAAGTYWVAVSGVGNNWFNPFIAGSGYPGSTGDYGLTLQAADLPAVANKTPTVLYSNPGNGGVVNDAPLVVRLDYSAPLDANTLDNLSSTQLVWSPTSNLADPQAQSISLASIYFSAAANELQLESTDPLLSGYYGVILADGGNTPALTFQIAGVQGQTMSHDTAATAVPLGDLTSSGLIQVAGVIGNDPDPLLVNPASQVNLYQFQISGPGRYAFGAEVFAGRIGSALDAGVSLYQWNPATGRLDFVDGNDNTLNLTQSTNGMTPLYTDSALFAGLTAGDYYVAVSGGGNTPERALGAFPGQNGIFDPNYSDSGVNGATVGNYVLNLTLQAENDSPQVVAVTPGAGTTLEAPPTQLTVQFSESVDLQALAYQAYQQTSQTAISSVYVEGPDGTKYYPRLVSYNDATYQADFQMLDGLANGTYQLHLSGPRGLTDLAGNPLVGNDPSGDYVESFTVNGFVRGVGGDPLLRSGGEPNDSQLVPQNLGVLFPNELQTGITVSRGADAATAPADTADYYQFQVLQNRDYTFILSGSNLPDGVRLDLYDAAGKAVTFTPSDTGDGIQAFLAPGVYEINVSGWTATKAGQTAYRLHLGSGESGDNAPPLTTGAAPALQFRLVTSPPPAGATPPQVVVPTAPVTQNPSPSGSGDGGIVQVSFGTASTNGQQVSFVLPNGALQQLGSHPLGGVTVTNAAVLQTAADRIVFGPPETSAPSAVLANGVSLTQLPVGVGNSLQAPNTERIGTLSPADSSCGGQTELLSSLEDYQEEIRDYVISGWTWWDGTMTRLPVLAGFLPADIVSPGEMIQGKAFAATQEATTQQIDSELRPRSAAVKPVLETTAAARLASVSSLLVLFAGIGFSALLRPWRKGVVAAASPQMLRLKSVGNAKEELDNELLS